MWCQKHPAAGRVNLLIVLLGGLPLLKYGSKRADAAARDARKKKSHAAHCFYALFWRRLHSALSGRAIIISLKHAGLLKEKNLGTRF